MCGVVGRLELIVAIVGNEKPFRFFRDTFLSVFVGLLFDVSGVLRTRTVLYSMYDVIMSVVQRTDGFELPKSSQHS